MKRSTPDTPAARLRTLPTPGDRLILAGLLLALAVVGCRAGQSLQLEELLADVVIFPGWTPAGDVALFDQDNLYDLVNGQADAFFAYAFQQVAVRRYENAGGNGLDVQVWQLATPADAYGLFTISRSGAPANIGAEGDVDPGRRLAFWQDRFYVHLRARQELPGAELQSIGQAISAGLPAGGDRPPLVDRLPSAGLVAQSAIFFHQELSIQDHLWLGGENPLGLSPETDGVLARYDLDGAAAQLLLVQYPDAAAAAAALAALADGQATLNPVSAGVRSDLLGALFGAADETGADALLERAFGNR